MITNLRKKEKQYENMYVNYFIFKLKEKDAGLLCSDERIWVPSLEEYVNAPLCYCFGRPPILRFELPEETLQYYQELSFYPLSRDQIAVYKINLPGKFYTLLEIFDNIIWENLSIDDINLFKIPLPISYSDPATLQKMLNPFIKDLTTSRYVFAYLVSKSNLNKILFINIDRENFRISLNACYWCIKYKENV